jgi:CRP/FNR family transcriptional regulator, nitrogen oxide reductase regulator
MNSTAGTPSMAPHEIAALVNKLNPRLLEGLAPDDLTCVLDVGTIRRFRRHALLAREGYSADNLFLLLEGLGRTFTTTPKGEKMVLLWISPGELSGGRAILSQPSKYLVSTETVTNSTALVWERKTMLSLSKRFSRLLENALLISSDYLAAYRDFHVAANYETAPQRVAHVLSNLAHTMGREDLEGITIEISNEELANQANVSVFTISRLMSEWQLKGFLLKKRRQVVLLTLKELLHDNR